MIFQESASQGSWERKEFSKMLNQNPEPPSTKSSKKHSSEVIFKWGPFFYTPLFLGPVDSGAV